MKMAESFPNVYKTLWEKEKSFIMSNFSFSHSVFKRLVLQTCHGKGLKVPQMMISILNLSQTSPGYYMSAVQVSWKHYGKRRKFLLFPECFSHVWRTFCHFQQIWNCRLQTLSFWKNLKFVVWERVKCTSCGKRWMLITIFSFSNNV